MLNFNDLLETSSKLDITKEIESQENAGKSEYKDDGRYYKLAQKNKKGRAIIRFMPGIPYTDDMGNRRAKAPFFSYKKRVAKHDGKFLITPCLYENFGVEDPARNFMFALYKAWKSGDTYAGLRGDSLKQIANGLQPKDHYISLIYVQEDHMDSERDMDEQKAGSLFLYEYKAQIYNKIKEATKKEDEFGQALDVVNPFSIGHDGANFGLILQQEDPAKVDSIPDYAKSRFLQKEAFMGGDAEAFNNMMQNNQDRYFDIHDEITQDKVQSYEDIEKRLIQMYGDLYIELTGDKIRVDISGSSSSDAKPSQKEGSVSGFDLEENTPSQTDLDDEIPDFGNVEEKAKTEAELDDAFGSFFNS